MAKGVENRKIETHIACIKFHTAELIAEILRHDPDEADTSAHVAARKYDYLDGRRDMLSYDGKEKSVTVLDLKRLATLLRFMGEIGLLKGQAYKEYLKLKQPSKAEIGATDHIQGDMNRLHKYLKERR